MNIVFVFVFVFVFVLVEIKLNLFMLEGIISMNIVYKGLRSADLFITPN